MNCLTIRSSSEWKLITARRPPGRSISTAAGKRCLELAELVVDGDPQCLEDALGGMPLAEAGGRRDRRLDHVDEIAGAEERLLGAATHDRTGDRARVALLPVAAEDRRQLALVPGVDDRRGGDFAGRIHPHVERRVGGVREAALRPVDLHRRDADVEQDRVGLDAVGRELREHDREVTAEEAHVDSRLRLEAIEVRLRGRVTVDRNELALPVKVGGEETRMTTGAERRIDDGLTRLHGEKFAHLVRENRGVIRCSVRQDVGQHGRHSLRSLPGAPPRRRDPRSRGGRCSRSP